MKKKLLIITFACVASLLVLTLVGCGLFGSSSNNSSSNNSVNEVEQEPTYEKIATAAELADLANKGGRYQLANDIDLSDEEWSPIDAFTGELNGDGKTIRGLNISGNKENIGLFSTLKGTVKNLSLADVNITMTGNAGTAGALCGTNEGKIEDVTVGGRINAPYYNLVGGIAGKSTNTNISNCQNQIQITAYDTVGGIVGNLIAAKKSTFGSNKNSAIVNGNDNVGGIIGSLTVTTDWNNWEVSISDNGNNGQVIGSGDYIGGIIGKAVGWSYSSYTHTIAISDCSNKKEISGRDYVAGIIGYGSYINEISTCGNAADVSGNNYVGGYAGYTGTRTSIQLAENNNIISGKAYIGGIAGSTGTLINCTNNGEIISSGVVIESSNRIACVGGIAGCAKSLEKCTNNRDINVTTQGYYIAGVVGLLNPEKGSSVKQCKNDSSVIGNYYVGGIIGSLKIKADDWNNWDVSVSDNENNGEISGSGNYVGGIFGSAVGWSYSSYTHTITLSSCNNKKEISGNDYTGGIVGYGEYIDEISACNNTADVSGNNYVGGYAGYTGTRTSIQLAENNNTISGKAYIGGIAGSTGSLTLCTNNGEIISSGVIIESTTGIACVGGIAGYAKSLEKCTNNTDITVTTQGYYVAGIVGLMNPDKKSSIRQCKNYGSISGNYYVGGIIGSLKIKADDWNNWDVNVSDNENHGDIIGSGQYVGGIVGSAIGWKYSSYTHTITISNCINNKEIDGSVYCGGIIGYGEYVPKTDAIWETNTSTGAVSGSYSGAKYGYLK
ncbi:MAG: hypothetical protein J6Y74_04305 [Clostridia bacterium]|nr:hypothetical protein [Clostridia bacterium]